MAVVSPVQICLATSRLDQREKSPTYIDRATISSFCFFRITQVFWFLRFCFALGLGLFVVSANAEEYHDPLGAFSRRVFSRTTRN